jgi:hypothetical protein
MYTTPSQLKDLLEELKQFLLDLTCKKDQYLNMRAKILYKRVQDCLKGFEE